MIERLAQVSPLRMALLAVAWPAMLGFATLVGFLWLTRGGVMLVSLHVSSWPVLLLVLFGPSAVLIALWIVGRRRRGM